MQDVLKKEQQINHPINLVWNAITKAEEISSWFIQAEFKAEVGYKYTFTHEKTTITGKVLEANPVHKLVYTWKVNGTDVDTVVSWNLSENENGTLIQLEHSGISKYPGESAVKMFESFSGGWDHCMTELENYLTKMVHAK